jgi:hypothetical protein
MNLLHRFNRREILYLGVLTAILTGILALEGIRTLADHHQTIARSIAAKQDAMERLAERKNYYDIIHAELETKRNLLKQRSPEFSLVSFLSQLAEEAGIQEQIQQIQPSRVPSSDRSLQWSMVDMKLRAVPLRQLVDWIERIETSGLLISVSSAVLTISETSPDRIDLTIQVQTLEP